MSCAGTTRTTLHVKVETCELVLVSLSVSRLRQSTLSLVPCAHSARQPVEASQYCQYFNTYFNTYSSILEYMQYDAYRTVPPYRAAACGQIWRLWGAVLLYYCCIAWAAVLGQYSRKLLYFCCIAADTCARPGCINTAAFGCFCCIAVSCIAVLTVLSCIARALSTLKLYPGIPRPSTTPDSWAVAERHRANICSDVAWAVTPSPRLVIVG